MDHETRRAETAWLRSRVAAGSEDITRIHLPLIGHCIADGETAEAVRLSIVAADHLWALGLYLKAFAVLKRALEVDPENPELTRRHAAWSVIVHPDLLAVIEPSRRPGGVVVPLWPALEESHRERITRCVIRVVGDLMAFRVAFDHDRPLPAGWVAGARYALAIVGHGEPIPCTTRVLDGQRFHHELELTPDGADAVNRLHALTRVDPVTELSSIEALVITTNDGLPPYRVRNVYCVASLGTIAEA